MMWKKLVSGVVSLSVVCASLTTASIWMGKNAAAAEEADPLVYQQRYEAEEGEMIGGAGPGSSHTGYTGDCYVAGLDNPNRGVTVTVDVPRAGSYMIGVRYSASNPSTMGVYVGENADGAQTMHFGKVLNASWENWSTSYIALDLAEGENDITFLRRDGVDGGAINMDSVTVTDSVIYEAEDAATFPEERNPATDHTGYSGRGFMAHYNQDGNGTEFRVDVARAGVYTVAFRYQSAQGDTRTLSLYVNGEETAYAVSFPRNNQDWTDDIWTYATINIPLQAGENILRLQKEDVAGAYGELNVDYLAVPNRLLAAAEVPGGIPNGDFANEDPNDVPTDWATDTGDNKHMGVNDASPVAGKNVYLWDGDGEFKQGISQTLTGLEEGWYAVTFYKQNNDIVPKSQQVELVAADGVSNQLVMPYTTGGQWQAVEMIARVGESGQLTLHASIDGNKGSSLMLGKFQLFKLTDKSELYDQIAAGAGLSSEDYTASSWQAYQTALTTAQDVLANSGSQPAIDAAASDLEAKRTALEEPVEETYTASQQIVDQKYEAEDAQLLNGAEINTDHTGYTGTGFIGQIDQGADRGIAFTVNVPRADTYTIGIRYAASQNTTMGIWSGGDASAAKTVQMVRSWNYPDNTNGSWENWSTAYTTLDLQKGENVITLQRRDTDSNVANIDFITVTDGVLYEAEDGEIIPEHREPATDHVNYSGRGFMAGLGDTGRGIVFDVNVDRAGIYTVAFAYQSSHDSTRTMNVYVNDGDTASTVSFAKNNRDWSEDVWSRVYVNLELQAGDNTIKLIKDEENNGDINIDYMMVSNRLWELEDVTDSIQNPRFADGLTGWTMDDPDGVNYKVVDTDNGIAGNTLLRMGDSAEAFKQGVSQTVTGLDDGWYILAMYKLVGGPVQNRIDLEVTTGEGGTDGVLHLGNTPNNVWVVVSAAVQVVGGEMTIHVSNDATGDSYLQITQFHLYKVLDRTELYDQIASGSDLKAEDYTPDSWQAYQTALTAANAAMTEATAQKTLDTAARILAARQGELAPVDGSHTISLVSPAGADITLSSTAAKEGDTVTVQINALPAGQVLDTITAADAGGNPVTLTAGENGVYTFTMPDSNVTVTVTLKAAALTIKSVEALAALTVDYGTAYADLELPETVKVTLSDDTTAEAAITWAEGNYDGETAGTYTLTGTLSVEGAENPDNLTASIQVTVKEEVVATPTIKSVEDLTALTVDYGTAYADLELPETVKVTLSDDTTADAAITWAEGDYDGNTAGTYTLTGTLRVDGAENPDNLTASIQVTVKEKESVTYTVSVEAGENGTVTPGSLQVEAGEDAVFTITPDEGYTVEEIAISPAVENTLENGVLTIADVQADTKVTVTFKLLDADEETAVLEEALSDANQLLEEAVTGDAPGQYPAAAIEAFQAAVAEAQAVLEDENADAAALAEAVTRLAHAQEVFLAARIADDVNSGDDSSNSDNSTSDTPDSGTSSGDGTATNGGSQTGTEQSDNFKTGSAIPALAVSLLALSAGAVWMTGRKRRTK
ncbi:MAG TPA: Ig-like domain-containing protein [Firmicutes bacterium]|nr:Ig-like domain-containing protein [Bacillota bacterium]